jgi:hypothetical protein
MLNRLRGQMGSVTIIRRLRRRLPWVPHRFRCLRSGLQAPGGPSACPSQLACPTVVTNEAYTAQRLTEQGIRFGPVDCNVPRHADRFGTSRVRKPATGDPTDRSESLFSCRGPRREADRSDRDAPVCLGLPSQGAPVDPVAAHSPNFFLSCRPRHKYYPDCYLWAARHRAVCWFQDASMRTGTTPGRPSDEASSAGPDVFDDHGRS